MISGTGWWASCAEKMAAQDPVIVTPSADPDLPNRQDWLNLDQRGNWISFESQVQDVTTAETRTLAPESGGGGT